MGIGKMRTVNANEIKVLSGCMIELEGVALRLFGVWTSDTSTRGGMAARVALNRKLEEHGTVWVNVIVDRRKTKRQDLCEIITSHGENIGHWMVAEGFAQVWLGGGA